MTRRRPPPAPPTCGSDVPLLAARGRRALAIDHDQQGNLTTRLGVTEDQQVEAVAADVMLGTASVQQAAIEAPSVPGAMILVGTHDLADLDQRPEVITSLRDYLPELSSDFDDVVIDTPPALGIVTLAALAAGDQVIASVACETEAYDQLTRLNEVIAHRVAPRLRRGQRINWIIPTRHDSRQLLDRDVVEQLNTNWPGQVTTPVREAVAARDAYPAGMPASIYAPGSGIATDYANALSVIVDQEQRS